MVGIVRLYVQPGERLPAGHVPECFEQVLDLVPEEAQKMRKTLRRQGYEVISVPL